MTGQTQTTSMKTSIKSLPRNVWAVSLTSFFMDISSDLIADLVPQVVRLTAYGSYNAVIGILDFPASLIARLLWHGARGWAGFGPAAPFLFGALTALGAALLLAFRFPHLQQAGS